MVVIVCHLSTSVIRFCFFFFSSRRRHTRCLSDWSSDVCSSDLERQFVRASLMNADLLMRSLGRPNREQVVTTRENQLTTLQALDLANGQILADTLSRGAANLLRENPKASADELVELVYLRALSRKPTADE